MARSC